MKKNILCIVAIASLASNFIQAQRLKTGYTQQTPTYKKTVSKKLKITMLKEFKPVPLFGGADAYGFYDHKSKTATIKNGKTNFFFKEIIESLDPETTPKGKHISEKIQKIGYFSQQHKDKKGMLSIMYLYGVQTEPNHKNMPGSSPATYAPKLFTPAKEYSGVDLVGNYFKYHHIATIHNPLDPQGSKSYTFYNVGQYRIDEPIPDGLVYIGSYHKTALYGLEKK